MLFRRVKTKDSPYFRKVVAEDAEAFNRIIRDPTVDIYVCIINFVGKIKLINPKKG